MIAASERRAPVETRSGSGRRAIAVVTGGIPHYRWPFFSELANRAVAVHLVAAGRMPAGILATPSPDSRIGIRHLSVDGPRWRSDVVAELRCVNPDVVLVEHGSALDYSWTTLLSRQINAPRVLWTHGIARQELHGGKGGPASWGRWLQLSLADGILCYDEEMARRLAARFPGKSIGSAPNSTDGTAIAAQRLVCEREGQPAVRNSLGLDARFYLAGLGRLVAEKDFGRLLRIAAALRASGIDVGVILIGSGPEERALRAEARALGMAIGRDVVFTGGISDAKTMTRWLFAADACVNPGPLGLSTVDCLFAGLPVLSVEPSRRGVHHGPEWRYLTHGQTGWFATANDEGALAALCREYLERPADDRARVRAGCVEYAGEHLGIAKMADGMLAVVDAAIAQRSTGHRA